MIESIFLIVKLRENGPYLCITNVLRIFIKSGRLSCLIEEFCSKSRLNSSNKRIKLGEQYSEERSRNISNQDIKINKSFVNPDEVKKLNSLLKGIDFIDINSKKRSTISGLRISQNKKYSKNYYFKLILKLIIQKKIFVLSDFLMRMVIQFLSKLMKHQIPNTFP